MFEGTGYAVAEIVFWMAAAALVGFLLGWILRRWFVTWRHQREYDAALAEGRRREEDLERRLAAKDAALARVQGEIEPAVERAVAAEAAVKEAAERLAGTEAELAAARGELAAMREPESAATGAGSSLVSDLEARIRETLSLFRAARPGVRGRSDHDPGADG